MGRLIGSLLLPVVALGVCACAGTETGNPGRQAQLAISARSSDETKVTLNDVESELRVDSALISLANISLVSCSGDEIARLPATVVDLKEPDSTPFAFETTSATACELVFDVMPPADDSGPLGNYSLVIGGARADGTPFQVNSRFETHITLSSGEPFEVGSLILAFDVAVWLDPVEVHGAVLHEDVAQIDDQANPEILAAIELRTAISAELFVDADADGHLDADESVPVASAQ